MSSSFFPAHLSCSFCLQTGSQKLGVFQRTAYKVNATQVFANLQKNALFLRVFANLLKKRRTIVVPNKQQHRHKKDICLTTTKTKKMC